ncbi:unnamed protein product [Arabis nemorensis]|uniref:NYN domain-containing protein n=1 Tax=Arabis nemorensis TaxID=586526 RepID=A0A565BYE0_9BRAS|nr:unnamed protein product [Arabis nemorensis]
MSSLNSKYAGAKTGVFWDIEDCPIPNGLDPVSVYRNIKTALANQGYRGEVTIKAFKEKKTIRNDFELAGINLEIAGDKHGRFTSMYHAFFSWVLQNRDTTNLLIISRDKTEFVTFLQDSVGENYNVLVAESEDPPEKCSKCGVALDKPPFTKKPVFGNEEWFWTSLANGGDPITTITKCKKPKVTQED